MLPLPCLIVAIVFLGLRYSPLLLSLCPKILVFVSCDHKIFFRRYLACPFGQLLSSLALLWTATLVFQQFPVHSSLETQQFLGCFWTSAHFFSLEGKSLGPFSDPGEVLTQFTYVNCLNWISWTLLLFRNDSETYSSACMYTFVLQPIRESLNCFVKSLSIQQQQSFTLEKKQFKEIIQI